MNEMLSFFSPLFEIISWYIRVIYYIIYMHLYKNPIYISGKVFKQNMHVAYSHVP